MTAAIHGASLVRACVACHGKLKRIMDLCPSCGHDPMAYMQDSGSGKMTTGTNAEFALYDEVAGQVVAIVRGEDVEWVSSQGSDPPCRTLAGRSSEGFTPNLSAGSSGKKRTHRGTRLLRDISGRCPWCDKECRSVKAHSHYCDNRPVLGDGK